MKRTAREIDQELREQAKQWITTTTNPFIRAPFDACERFLVNLLSIVCQYSQLQHNTEQPVEHLFIDVDVSWPRKEIDFLPLQHEYELELPSERDMLLNLLLQSAFVFQVNPFSHLSQLDRQNKSLIELVVPIGDMLQRQSPKRGKFWRNRFASPRLPSTSLRLASS